MRNRVVSILSTVALAVPAAGVLLDGGVRAAPAGAVSTTPAWTKTIAGWNRSSSPTIADVNGDRVNDVVFGHQDGELRVVSGSTGDALPGWPQQTGSAIDSSPAVADLTHSGKKNIVVGVGSTWRHNQSGGVLVYNADGTRRCTFRTRDSGNVWANNPHPDGYPDPVFSSPAIGDINGDGFPDIVFGSFDLHIYAIDRNCHKLIDDNVEDSVWSSPVLRDIDGDGRMEIFIGGDQYKGGAIDWSGGEFRALKWSPGSPGGVQELWKRQVRDTIWSSPALGDIDGDGRVEVVVGAGFFYHRDDGRRIFAWHADDGSAVTGWPVMTGGYTMPSPALGDVNGDGVPEVVVGSSDGFVRAYRGNGSQLWARGLTFNDQHVGGSAASPIVADMNGDGQNDVGVGNDWGFFVLDGRSGTVQAEVNTWLSHESAGAVGEFADGWKLIVSGFDTPGKRSTVQAFDMPAPGTTPPWPMFHRDAAHHGGPVGKNLLPPGYCRRSTNPKAHPVTASSQGYWIAGADGSVFALEGRAVQGQSARACLRSHHRDGRDQERQRLLHARQRGSHLHLRRRALARFDGREALERTDHRDGADSQRQGLLVARTRRRRVHVRRRALLRFDRQQASQRADHLDVADEQRQRVLAARIRRRRVQLRRRAVPRFDGEHEARGARHLDGGGAVGSRLLVGRAGRWRVQLRSAVLRQPARQRSVPGTAGCADPPDARRPRVLRARDQRHRVDVR